MVVVSGFLFLEDAIFVFGCDCLDDASCCSALFRYSAEESAARNRGEILFEDSRLDEGTQELFAFARRGCGLGAPL